MWQYFKNAFMYYLSLLFSFFIFDTLEIFKFFIILTYEKVFFYLFSFFYVYNLLFSILKKKTTLTNYSRN